MICKRLLISIHSTKPSTRLVLLFAKTCSFVTALFIILDKRMNKTYLFNKVTKYFKIPTCLHFTYLFENGQKILFRNEEIAVLQYFQKHDSLWERVRAIACSLVTGLMMLGCFPGIFLKAGKVMSYLSIETCSCE